MVSAIGGMQHPAQIDLGDGLTMGGLAEGDAEGLATCFGAIDPWVRYGTSADGLKTFIGQEEPGAARFVFRYRGERAGLAIVRADWLRGPYLQFLGLENGFQGRGIGTRFLDWLAADAAAAGHRHVWIMVSDFNTRARAFYARAGYQEIATVPDVVKDGFDEILLRKRV
ncbi:MAG: GNAT family N-acetyltransferase [Alphaproteobacteria bacterium]|nr:GNAT family N-acetyltransferase [Alphaproteobacteria bacterium]